MGGKSTIIKNPVGVKVEISRGEGTLWKVTPQLKAFPKPHQPMPRNIIFILDTSLSMRKNNRLIKVKEAVSELLDQLTDMDTFSIVSFNDVATCHVNRKKASRKNISAAKDHMEKMQAGGSTTKFSPAFEAVNTQGLIQAGDNSTIIFLTDGEDKGADVEKLLEFFGKKIPRIIPIGVFVKKNVKDFLNNLSGQSGNDQAIYVDEDSQNAYKNAFQTAIRLTIQQSQNPAQLEMTIKAEEGNQSTQLGVKRPLSPVCFDGRSFVLTTLNFDSPTPPYSLKLVFSCDDAFLEAEYKMSSDEQTQLQTNKKIERAIHIFKWKDNSIRSWVMLLGSLTLGLLMLGGAVVFAYLSLLKLGLTIAISTFVGLAGLCLLVHGIINLVRKTVFLPTKFAVNHDQPLEEKDEKEEKNEVRGSTNIASVKPTKRLTWLSSKSIFVGSVLAAGGGAAGYFGGTAIVASTATTLGMNASLFIGICAAGGAIVLPLLAYCCIAHNNSISKTGYSYTSI
ncbi:MAG: hypothetical protein K0R24_2234 [Gammaproteobacteria bacterium]|jgi:hypothetical protein|nr:hypothetical protein [Gammaproteobacteria bacterium]